MTEKLLDPSLFPMFRPLLEQLVPYGQLTGARFRSKSFTEAQLEKEANHTDELVQQKLQTKLESIHVVQTYTQRLQSGEVELVEEYRNAARLVMQESVRRAIKATLLTLDLWPGENTPVDVADIEWEDMSAKIDVVARRCYNYDRLVATDPIYKDRNKLYATGSFLVDFGQDALQETTLDLDATSQSLMRDFVELIKRHERKKNVPEPIMRKAQKVFLDALTQHGRWPDHLVKGDLARQWFEENGALVAGGIVAAAIVGIGAYLFSKRRRSP